MNFRYYKTGPLVIFILVLSVIGGLANTYVTESFKGNAEGLQILDYVGVVSVVGIITMILAVINKWGWAWKIGPLKLFGWLVDLPDMRGRYTGELTSSYKINDRNKVMKCAFEITQTASKTKVFSYYFDPDKNEVSSEAKSVLEEVVKEDNGLFRTHFVFTNEPGTLQESLNKHDGTAWILYYPDVKKLKMEYYNKRQNIGHGELKFEQKKTIGRYEKEKASGS